MYQLTNTDPANPTRFDRFRDDYLLRDVLPGETVQVNLDSTEFDTYLQLVNADTGDVIAFNDDANSSLNSELNFTVEDGIDYILRTTSFGIEATGEYNLTLNTGTATPATLFDNNQIFTGTLDSTDPDNPTRVDRFRDDYLLRDVMAGDEVQVNLDSTEFDTYVQLVNADTGDVIVFNDDANGSLNSQLNFTVEDGIDYILRTTSFGVGATGNYSLNISAPSYVAGTLDNFDNDNPTRRDRFHDDYRLEGVVAGETVQINLDSADFDTYLQLVNADTGDVIDFNDDSSGSLNSELSFTVEDGIDYLVRTTSYGTGATGNYTLRSSTGNLSEQERLNFNLNFQTSDRSLWGSGNAIGFEDERFLGVEWDESGSSTLLGETVIIPEVCAPWWLGGFCTPEVSIPSLGVSGETNGQVGFNSDLNVNGGSVSAALPIELWLDVPDTVQAGETITIRSGFSLADDAGFTTTSPTGSYDLDLVFDVGAAAGVQVGNSNYNLFDFDISETANLLNLDSSDLSYDIPSSWLGGFGSASLHFPSIETEGTVGSGNTLSAQGSDVFFEGALDLDNIATSVLALPPLEDDFDKGFSLAGFDLGVNGGYNLLDVELAPDLSLSQEFDLTLDDLTGELILENGDRIDFVVGEEVTLTVPDNVGDSLEIDALINPDASFSNTTSLGYDVDVDLSALSFHGGADIGPFSPGFDIGPLVDESVDVIDGDLVTVYDETFALGGWNSPLVEFEIGIA